VIRPASPQQTTAFVLATLAPGATLQATTFGDGVLANIALAILTAIAVESFVAKMRGFAPVDGIRDGSGIVTATLLALALPPAVPLGIVIVGVLIALLIGKHVFGGAGANPFNPAMVGYAVLLLAFPGALAAWGNTTGTAIDGVTGPTVLDAFKHRGALTVVDVWTPTRGFGALGGSAWEWLNGAYLLGGAALIAVRVVDWRIPIAVLGALAFAAAISYDGGSSSSLGSPLFHCFSGGTMLAAFFVATDPVTAPTTARGRICYGVLIGATLFVIRTGSAYPDGIAFAVLLGNTAAPAIDRLVERLTAQRKSGAA
jgi:Na+-translocating ferredoxin:NAD+ oxidoreductase subunit D